ncbi:MAG: hypothetical protein ABJD13_08705 [Paracoccaceae bacterium]
MNDAMFPVWTNLRVLPWAHPTLAASLPLQPTPIAQATLAISPTLSSQSSGWQDHPSSRQERNAFASRSSQQLDERR